MSKTEKKYSNLGQYGVEIKNIPLINAKTEVKLSKQIKAGDIIARNKLVNANLKLVLTLAHQYSGNGLSLDELVAEGNIGLITAANKFDGKLGNRFSTYAYWWIKSSMFSAMENAHYNDGLKSTLVLEDVLNMDHEDIYLDNSFYNDNNGGNIKVYSYVDENKSDYIKDNDINNDFENEIDENMFKSVLMYIDKLTERESTIIKHYFGICEKEELGVKDISKKYNISSMRVSTIIESSLRKIRCGVLLEK